MSELDEKIAKIIMENTYEPEFHVQIEDDSLMPKAVKQIKHAFADAGYVNTKNVEFEGFMVKNLMTGAEWYQRYRYLCMSSGYYSDDLPMMKLARRAAGLEENMK